MRNKAKAITAVAVPIGLLIIVLLAYAVVQFVAVQIGADINSSELRNAMAVIRAALGLLGMVAVIGLLVGIIYALITAGKPDGGEVSLELRQKHPELDDEAIRFIEGGSLAAFFGGPIWALGNRLWLMAFLAIIPFVGLIVSFYLAFTGRRMSWEKGGWTIDQFKRRQRTVAWVVVIFIILSVFLQIAASGL